MKRIVQMVPTLLYGDAVGNDILALREALIAGGYSTDIYAEGIDKRIPANVAKPIARYKDNRKTIILFHLAIGSKMNEMLKYVKAKVIIVYHNITPPSFFESYSAVTARLCQEGLESVAGLADVPILCFADSKQNKEDLIRMGYHCPIEVLPILIQFKDYEQEPDPAVINQYRDDGYVNLLFTGRIVPNKKHQDLLKTFYYYHTFVNPKSRLFLVGSYQEGDLYYRKLRKYADMLGVSDSVIFTGHIPFRAILAYYHIADVFLCMSEHEGFCVPLVEAMYFHVPIIAYASTAVPETLGGSGLLLKEKDLTLASEMINKVVEDDDFRTELVKKQDERLKDFDNQKIADQFLSVIRDIH